MLLIMTVPLIILVKLVSSGFLHHKFANFPFLVVDKNLGGDALRLCRPYFSSFLPLTLVSRILSETIITEVFASWLFFISLSFFLSFFSNWNSILRKRCLFSPHLLTYCSIIYIYQYEIMMAFYFVLYVRIQYYHHLFCCSNVSALATLGSCRSTPVFFLQVVIFFGYFLTFGHHNMF